MFDPVVFAVDDRGAVDAWAAHLSELGVPNQVVEATIGWMVLFHDPDGLEFRLYSRDRTGPHGRGQLRQAGIRPAGGLTGCPELSVGASTVSTVRVLHTADWHVGKSLKGVSRLDEQEQVLRDAEGGRASCRERV